MIYCQSRENRAVTSTASVTIVARVCNATNMPTSVAKVYIVALHHEPVVSTVYWYIVALHRKPAVSAVKVHTVALYHKPAVFAVHW